LVEEHVLCVFTATMSGDVPELAGALENAVALVDQMLGPPHQPYLSVLRAIAGGPPNRAALSALEAQFSWISVDDPWMWSLYTFGQGFFRMFDGRPDEAEIEFERALAGARSIGDRWMILQALSALADLAGAQGEHARAEELSAEALELADVLDAQADSGELLYRRGEQRVRAGELAGARTDYERAEMLGRRAGAPETAALAQIGLSVIDRVNGDLGTARRRCEDALNGFSSNWFSGSEVRTRAYESLGWICEREGDATAALAWLRRALADDYSKTNLPEAGRIAEGMAAVALLEDDGVRAAHLLGAGTVLRGTPATGDPDVPRVRARARALLGEAGFEAAHSRGAEVTRIALADYPAMDVLTALET
jgi:tetratricopeptide (TPR) repeat protein